MSVGATCTDLLLQFATGRFTSVDPLTASATIRNPQTFNRYSYVLNSPYKFTDPLGLISINTNACGMSCKGSDDRYSTGEGMTSWSAGGMEEDSAWDAPQTHQSSSPAAAPSPDQQDDKKKKKEDKKKQQDKQTKVLKVDVQDKNNLLDAKNMQALKDELSAVYSEIDVEVQFVNSGADYTLYVEQDVGTRSNAPDAVGATPYDPQTGVVKNYGYVFINQANASIRKTNEGIAAAGQDSTALGKALGRAGAHEVGHYLLQTNKHLPTDFGVMKKSFKGDEWFSNKKRSLWLFHKNDRKTIRGKLPDK